MMSRLLLQLRALSGELRRRKVVRVLVGYLVASAAIVGVASDVAPALGYPDAAVRVVIVLLVAGLPVAVFLAWAYDLVPDPGSAPAEDDEPAAPATGSTPADGAASSASGRPAPAQGGKAGPSASRHQASPAASSRGTLPAQTTPFIGRGRELEAVVRHVTDGACRLVTVLGAGGVGKTRLAVRAAEEVGADFRDGVVFVAMASLPSPDLLAVAAAEALGLTLSRRAEPLAELLNFLRGKQMLLVLDNMEHLTGAAADIAAILEAAPDVVVLVTSRERLGLAAEALVQVDGLSLGGPGDDSEAVQLFLAAARRQDLQFTLDTDSRPCVRRLCELLGGNALAIELAAAWTRVLSCTEIVAEVQRDLDILASDTAGPDGRHRSLGATFEASWRLLPAPERRALARLAVFHGPFERAAAEVVAGAELPLLRGLVDKSLLGRAGGRFHLLNVLRQYALKRLEASPDDATATLRRHTAYFCGLLRSLEPGLRRAEPEALRVVAEHIADVRAAWANACDARDADALLLAADGLFLFCDARGWGREGAEAFARAAAALEPARGEDAEQRVRGARGRLDVRRGALLDRLGRLAEGERLLRQGLATAADLQDDAELALALDRLGSNRWAAGDYDEAVALHDRARGIYQRLGDRHGIGWSLAHLGNVALARGEHQLAGELYTDALRILRDEDDRNGMCVALNNLSYIAIRRQHYDEARRLMTEALSLQAGLGNQRSAAYLLNNLGFAAREAGDYHDAAQHLQEALEISDRLGYQGMAASSLTGLAELHVRTGELARAQPLLQRALRIAAAIGDPRVALETLLTLGRLRAARGDTDGAARLGRFVAWHSAAAADTKQEADTLLERLGESPAVAPVSDIESEIADALAAELGGALMGPASAAGRT
jgi:predicted ATPase/Tfp pilus assembly protein PilF